MHKVKYMVTLIHSLEAGIMVYAKNSVVKDWGESDPTCQRFDVLVQRRRLAPSTKLTYIKNVKCFVDFLKSDTPLQALEKLKAMTIEERTHLIDQYVSDLMSRGVTTGAVVQMIRGGLKKWIELNEVEMDWNKIQDEILPGEEVVVQDRMPTKEELKELLNIGSLRDRTMILVLTSSGLRVGTLASLELGDIQLDEEIPRIIVKRAPGRKVSRRMKGFATFITPEAKTMLLQYIKHRESQGEKLTAESPLITSDRQEELGNFLSSMYLSNHWRRLLKRAHLAKKNGGPWHDIHLHTLRKYFETQCTNAAVKTAYREFWMGHTGRYLEESYFRGEVETHIEEYTKAIPYLNILAPEPQDYKALVEKVRFLEENGKRKEMELQRLRDQLIEQEDLKKRVLKVEKLLEKYAEEK